MNANKALWQSYSAEDLLKRSKAAGMPAMLITTGQQDAYVVPENRAFRDTLRRGGFSYQYREAPGLHDWTYWLDEQMCIRDRYTGMLCIYFIMLPLRKRSQRKTRAPALRRARAKIYGAGDGM